MNQIVTRNFNTLILGIAIVLVWRGIWGLADIYLIPNTPVLSFILSIIIGVIVLFMHNPKKHDISELL